MFKKFLDSIINSTHFWENSYLNLVATDDHDLRNTAIAKVWSLTEVLGKTTRIGAKSLRNQAKCA